MQEYTVQEKRRAISLAMKLGPMEAGRRLGIPDGTLSCWSFKARKAKREGGEWPVATPAQRSKRPRTVVSQRKAGTTGDRAVVETDRSAGPRLIAAEVDAEPVERAPSCDVAWELEVERGTVLRVRRWISSPELERVLAALIPEESS